jgi:2'-5' RNA ligase
MILYFIAIIPDEELRAKVKSLKEEMRDRFGAKHALKTPAHVTLVPPFKREETHERFISDFLRRFAWVQESFSLTMDGFGCFSPRVIYIDVKDPDPIRRLQAKMCGGLEDEYLLKPEELGARFSPHMTIATRDLDKEQFHRAWPEFKNRTLHANFEVKSVFLLKHNGKFWDIYSEFEFLK